MLCLLSASVRILTSASPAVTMATTLDVGMTENIMARSPAAGLEGCAQAKIVWIQPSRSLSLHTSAQDKTTSCSMCEGFIRRLSLMSSFSRIMVERNENKA